MYSNIHLEDFPVISLLVYVYFSSQHYGMHLALFVTAHLNSAELWKVAKAMALEVKARLVHHGGCAERLAMKIHLLCISDPLVVENFQVILYIYIYIFFLILRMLH
jgi:hypothetical protein